MSSPPAIRPAGIHHAAYRCRDAEQTRWFYEDVLGLPLAAALVLDEVPGTGERVPYMHLFFELGNGEFIAFFDQPTTAGEQAFARGHSFDRHIAFEVPDEQALIESQRRINEKGVSCLGPVDHGFVKSVYMYDPNGLQVELTCRGPDYEATMASDAASARMVLEAWQARTRAEKEQRFGAAAIDRRSRQQGRAARPADPPSD